MCAEVGEQSTSTVNAFLGDKHRNFTRLVSEYWSVSGTGAAHFDAAVTAAATGNVTCHIRS